MMKEEFKKLIQLVLCCIYWLNQICVNLDFILYENTLKQNNSNYLKENSNTLLINVLSLNICNIELLISFFCNFCFY
jgi:hypothetical protein